MELFRRKVARVGNPSELKMDNNFLQRIDIVPVGKEKPAIALTVRADHRVKDLLFALQAEWFLTNDKNIIDRTRRKPAQVGKNVIGILQSVGVVQGVHVAYPSECLEKLAFDPVWGLIKQE